MNDDFALLPWEYRGSGADTKSHATIPSLEVGGKVRRFLVKMREGVIYFKDAESGVIFAVLQRFESAMSADEMVEVARENIVNGNYGRYVARSHHFGGGGSGGASETVVCIIFQDGSGNGWLKEWFESDWISFSGCGRPRTAVKNCAHRLLGRTMKPEWRCGVTTHWAAGSQCEWERVMMMACRLLLSPGRVGRRIFNSARPTLKMSSPMSQLTLDVHASDFPHGFSAFIQAATNHFVARGLTWHRAYFPSRALKLDASRQTEFWGDDWRGNWRMEPNSTHIDVPLSNIPTAHERLELALELRDWLRNKLPEPEIESLLRDAFT